MLLTFWKIHEFLLIYYEYFTRNVESKSTLCLLFIRTKSYPRIFDAWITIDGINGKIDDRWLALNENVKGRFASPRPRVRFKSLSLSLFLRSRYRADQRQGGDVSLRGTDRWLTIWYFSRPRRQIYNNDNSFESILVIFNRWCRRCWRKAIKIFQIKHVHIILMLRIE